MNSTFDDESVTQQGVELNEPRFDEEATLLAAQPVVPLVEVKAKTRSKARLALAIAVGGGLLIGLLAATFLYRFLATKEAPVAETPAVIEQAKTDEQQNSSGGSTVSAEETAVVAPRQETAPVVTSNETESEKAKPAQPKAETAATAPRPRPIIVRETPRRSEQETSDDESFDREARRAERQEARRERRRAVREARRNRTETTDDLTRIREIFEGSPRP